MGCYRQPTGGVGIHDMPMGTKTMPHVRDACVEDVISMSVSPPLMENANMISLTSNTLSPSIMGINPP